MHYSADWVIFEPVDEHYRLVPVGQPSYSLLVTNLANYIQPIIRYELGDSVTMLQGCCDCGSPFPYFRVEGRTDEILSFPGQPGHDVRLLPLALESIIEETPGLRRFQLVQTGARTLSLRVEAESGAETASVWAAAEAHLRSYLEDQGVVEIGIERSSEPPRPNVRGGKLRHVLRQFTAPSPVAAVK